MNVRYFEMSNGKWWFGGGIDLTPHYVIPALAKDFHKRMKAVCDKFHPEFYERFKSWCDDYFFIRHRNETRGIGGIFFDHLNLETGITLSKEELLNFIIAVGDTFVPAYNYQVLQCINLPYGERELKWQELDLIGPSKGELVYKTERLLKRWLKENIGCTPGTTENWATTALDVKSLAELKLRSGVDTNLF